MALLCPVGEPLPSLGVTVDGDSSTCDEGWSIPRRDGEHMGWVLGTTCRDVDTLDVLSGPTVKRPVTDLESRGHAWLLNLRPAQSDSGWHTVPDGRALSSRGAMVNQRTCMVFGFE